MTLHAVSVVFFFNDTATTEIYTLSLHDALPISPPAFPARSAEAPGLPLRFLLPCSQCLKLLQILRSVNRFHRDRKSTRLNSSHGYISYAVFCLKKKNSSGRRRHLPRLLRLLMKR